MTCECCDNWKSWSFGDPVLHHPKWIQCDLLKPITLSLSSHTIQSVNNNPWRHWKDPQTSQVNKCPDISWKCPTGTKLYIAKKKFKKIEGKLKTPLEPPLMGCMIMSVTNRLCITCRHRGPLPQFHSGGDCGFHAQYPAAHHQSLGHPRLSDRGRHPPPQLLQDCPLR